MLNQNKKIKKIIVIIFLMIFLAVIFLFNQKALAVSIDLNINTGLGTASITEIISRIIQIFLGFLGVIALSLILYGGFIWMTAAGNEEKIARAKKILINAAIGLAIILAAFAIVTFIINQLIGVTTQGPGQPPGAGPTFPGSALGGGIIESVYPLPNSQNNPMNTLIIVTFKEQVTNIIDDSDPNFQSNNCGGLTNMLCGKLAVTNNEPNVQIKNNSTVGSYPGTFLPANQVVVMTNNNPVNPTNNNKTFVFDPVPLLGSSTAPTNYTVSLTNNILKVSNGQSALPTGFDWSFGIGTFSDVTPPYVVSVFPQLNTTVARNAMVQINFNEAINPVTATGIAQSNPNNPFNNITLTYNNGVNNVPGSYTIGNQYKTVEFLSSLDCGIGELNGQQTNSCGNPVYCLPANEDFMATAKADNVPTLTFIGISDAAGNSLDGDHDGFAEGPPDDNYWWEFSTNDQLDLDPPVISSVVPGVGEGNIPLNIQTIATFSATTSATTINTTNYILLQYDSSCVDATIAQPDQYGQYPNIPDWCWPGGFGVGLDNGNQAKLWTYANLESLTSYNPRLLSYIKDLYQNCFYPSSGP